MSIRTPIYEDPAWTPPLPSSSFDSIVSGFEVEQALAAQIRKWMPDYLLELERQRGFELGVLPTFKSEVPTSFEADRLREDQLPALAIVARGTSDQPEIHNSDGAYSARFQAECISVCTGRGNRQARRLAQWYAACVRALLIQWPLDDTELSFMRIDWIGERYQTRSPTEERTYGEGVVIIQAHIMGVTYRNAGPSPMFQPGNVGLLPEALHHEVVVNGLGGKSPESPPDWGPPRLDSVTPSTVDRYSGPFQLTLAGSFPPPTDVLECALVSSDNVWWETYNCNRAADGKTITVNYPNGPGDAAAPGLGYCVVKQGAAMWTPMYPFTWS